MFYSTFSGRLTRDPEFKFTKNGHGLCNFTVAAKSAGQKEPAYLDCKAWDPLATNVSKLKKGAIVTVVAEAQTESWETNGQKRSRLVFCPTMVVDTDISGQILPFNKSTEPSSEEPPKTEDQDSPPF